MKSLIQALIILLTSVGTAQAQELPTKTDKYGITMIKIPGGTFMMGDNSCRQVPALCDDPFDKTKKITCPDGREESKCKGSSRESPVHKVTLSSFWMSQTEVTQAQYYKVMGSNPSKWTSDALGYRSENNPVELVTWSEAKKFCEKLGYRLPTEAEWEYAARAGTTGDYYGSLNRIAWHQENSDEQTHPVAKKYPNSFGLYDMLGNVTEWVNDWYAEGYYFVSPRSNPKGQSQGYVRVLRGGSFRDLTKHLRVSYRFLRYPDLRDVNFGFRCAQ